MTKLLIATVAFTALFSGAAFAEESFYPRVVQGTGSPFVDQQHGIPIILPFATDRTARRYRNARNFQPGPFKELGPDDKVEWR